MSKTRGKTISKLQLLSVAPKKNSRLSYVSKVWRFLFIWAGLALFFSLEKCNKGKLMVMATYLQQ